MRWVINKDGRKTYIKNKSRRRFSVLQLTYRYYKVTDVVGFSAFPVPSYRKTSLPSKIFQTPFFSVKKGHRTLPPLSHSLPWWNESLHLVLQILFFMLCKEVVNVFLLNLFALFFTLKTWVSFGGLEWMILQC